MSKRVVATGKNGAILFVRNENSKIECWYIAYPHSNPAEEGYSSVPHNGKRDHVLRAWRERYAA